MAKDWAIACSHSVCTLHICTQPTHTLKIMHSGMSCSLPVRKASFSLHKGGFPWLKFETGSQTQREQGEVGKKKKVHRSRLVLVASFKKQGDLYRRMVLGAC